jgi:hypothetical protein
VSLKSGAAPAAAAVPDAPSRLPFAFVFASGRRCETIDDLIRGCQDEWTSAGELLRQGAFRQFFTGTGRLDLARIADEAARQPNDDLALDDFLAHLPSGVLVKPKLDLQPRRILLGVMRRGEVRQTTIGVSNIGAGLLTGTIAVTEGSDWLTLQGANAAGVLTLQVVRDLAVRIQVDTRKLVAPAKFAGKLTLITNGGIVEVPVRLELTAQPYPKAPFIGAASPRDLAVRMRAQPKAAGPALESGEVARWFEQNSWAYPVVGPQAPGTAAVQQFFECMGLAKPPRVRLEETEAFFSCGPGERPLGQASLVSADRKWIYAHASADADWLRVTTPVVSGPQKAAIDFEADPRRLEAGIVHEGTLRIVSNSGQTLSMRVRLSVRRPPAPAGARWLGPVLVGAVAGLIFRLLLALPADIYARALLGGAGPYASWLEAPHGSAFLRPFVLASWWPGAFLGAWLMARRGRWLDIPFGVIAGAAAGLAAAGTFGCLLPAADALPRLVWHHLAGIFGNPALSRWLVMVAWVLVASLCWSALGAAMGLLLGALGSRWTDSLGRPLAHGLRLLGLRRLAALVSRP